MTLTADVQGTSKSSWEFSGGMQFGGIPSAVNHLAYISVWDCLRRLTIPAWVV